jgi:alanine racemase
MEYAPQALIDHAALRHNLSRARQAAEGCRVWAVIKADGYGHGMLRIAEGLKAADGFAVARLDEALVLRRNGINKPVLVLSSCISRSDFEQAAEADVQVALHHPQQLAELDGISSQIKPLRVWLKADTGMHRLGFGIDEISVVVKRLTDHPVIDEINLMTHLANADDPQDPLSQRQCERLFSLDLTPFQAISIANSGGLLGVPNSHADWVRPGIMLYGASPFINTTGENCGLRPVMTLRSRVIAVKRCQTGERIGYGGCYICPEAMPVAVIAAGYGDGYPRHAPSGTPVLVNGVRLPLVGRVSMDMISVDARNLPEVQVGDEAVLWGEGLAAEEVAQWAGTIAYELFCGVKQRVTFVDLNGEEREE